MNNAEKPQLTIPRVSGSVFCSDNLELMKTIESNTIDLIYCDILYGTGRNFGDYQDLKPVKSIIDEHYIPRIKEMHRILKPTGSIYLQMDTRINHWIRCIMDDIFGYNNFRNEIIWGYKTGGTSKNEYSKKHDVILFYTKTKNYYFENPRENKVYIDKSRGYDPNLKYEFDEIGEYTLGYYTDCFVLDTFSTRYGRVAYQTNKPVKLIERLIKSSSKQGDLVADFYMGSGTTAEVCKDLKRNFIGCDINPRAIEITLQRLNDARS
jgi:DNA modification methylase